MNQGKLQPAKFWAASGPTFGVCGRSGHHKLSKKAVNGHYRATGISVWQMLGCEHSPAMREESVAVGWWSRSPREVPRICRSQQMGSGQDVYRQFFALQSLTICGRYRLARAKEIIAEHFNIEDEIERLPR